MNSMGTSRMCSYQQCGGVVGDGRGWGPAFFLDHLLDRIRWVGPEPSHLSAHLLWPGGACVFECVWGGRRLRDSSLHLPGELTPHLTKGWQN